jgi:putative chitinase
VIQLTGRSNYQSFCNYMGDARIMEGCDYVAATYPFSSAGFWWKNNGMSQLIANGADIYAVTRRVNGGLNGIDDRIAYYQKAQMAIA